MKYCKIFDLEGDIQVVVKVGIDWAEDKAPFVMEVETDFDHKEAQLRPSIVHRFKTVEKRDKSFEAYSQETAQVFRDNIGKVIKEQFNLDVEEK